VAKERTLTEHGPPVRSKKAQRAQLGVLLVHSRGPVTPRAFALSAPATIGREDTAAISVEDPGVSRAHARLVPVGAEVRVEDLGSRNRTHVNGVTVSEQGTVAGPDAVIRLARTLLVVLPDVSLYLGKRVAGYEELVGGAALDDVRLRIRTISKTDTRVLILGETGTGKEVVARLLHAESGRTGPFVALNCAAVPPDLVDAELFGHAKGAFSGATTARTGLFRAAHGGTLFLDEIGELPAPVQAKLLRVLETSEVRAVGDDRPTEVDVRVVSATNRDVDAMAEHGDFRGDLLYRLAGLRVRLPSLGERIEDVPALVERFLEPTEMSMSAAALERLMLSPWPGNVRELRNTVASAAAIAKERGSDEIASDDVAMVTPARSSRQESSPPALVCGDDEEGVRLRDALTQTSGDVARAAEQLGMSRSALYEALRRARLNPKAFRKR
jgi:DNA-binding NtrC family response regulator